MFTIEGLKTQSGNIATVALIDDIKSNFHISKHAIEQLGKRADGILKKDRFDNVIFGATKRAICEDIDRNILAYINTDGSVNIAVSDWEYYVFAHDDERENWNLITYKELSWYGNNIHDKLELARKGYARKEN